MNILVIDVGTSSMKGTLINEKADKIFENRVKYQPVYREHDIVEQDADEWLNALCDIVRMINQSIDCISITSQRSSVIPIDENGTPLMPTIMWQDRRSIDICKKLNQYNEKIFKKCGSEINTVFSGGKMMWIREKRPDIYDKSFKLLVVPDYLIYKMTGNTVTDKTYASRSLLMNLRSGKWDEELLELFHIDRGKLCDIIKPGTICGKTSLKFQKATGLPGGTPVVSAGGDQQCGAIGQGVYCKGTVSITCGTGAFLIAGLDMLPQVLKNGLVYNASSIENKFIVESKVLNCCSSLNWFWKIFYENSSMDELDNELKKTALDSHDTIFVPYFQSSGTPDWNNIAKGMFANITLTTTKEDILRSLLEGICYEIVNHLEKLSTCTKIEHIYCNGGLTKSEVFNQILSDICGQEIINMNEKESTTYGAWMIAAVELGEYRNYESAYQAITKNSIKKSYYPNSEKYLMYLDKRRRMNKLCDMGDWEE